MKHKSMWGKPLSECPKWVQKTVLWTELILFLLIIILLSFV